MEDKLLIWKFKRGSTDALCRIYDKHRIYLLKISTALINDKSTAEDVVHDVFVALAQSAKTIRVAGNLKSFLATCVANRARNINSYEHLRTTSGLASVEYVLSKSPRPDQWIVQNEQLDRLNQALWQLPYEQREVICLHQYGDMTFRKIARMQQASINTVQSRYRYGMNKLRSLLNGEIEK